MDITITSSTKEILRQNKCQMKFLENYNEKNFDRKLFIDAIDCSLLEYP